MANRNKPVSIEDIFNEKRRAYDEMLHRRVADLTAKGYEARINSYKAKAQFESWGDLLRKPPPPKEILVTPKGDACTVRIDFGASLRQAINGFHLAVGHPPNFVLVPERYEGMLYAWLGYVPHEGWVPMWNNVKVVSSPDVTRKVMAGDDKHRWEVDLIVEVTYDARR